ncbi:MAG: hypothetical protein P8H25_07815 [Flavobacteriaceae bacterium]|nr:hypothetical protein [Flavobacteriaceae bacterium]
MANNTGKKYGGRTKGTPNKISSQVKEKLQLLIDKTIDELITANLSVSHKLKLLELALNYTLPKLAHTYKEVDNKQKTFRVEYVGKTVDYNAEKN